MSVSVPEPPEVSTPVSAEAGGASPARGGVAVAARMRLVRRWHWRVLLVGCGVSGAFLLRMLMARHHPSFGPFTTFYPVVLLAALLDGALAGIVATLLSAAVAAVSVIPHRDWVVKDPGDILAIVIFVTFGVTVSVVIEISHRTRERLAHLELTKAVEIERHKVEHERQVANSIRAERQRFLAVLETLPSMISLLRPDHRVLFANFSFRQRFGDWTGRRCYEARFGRGTPCEDCTTFAPLRSGEPENHESILPDGSVIEAYDYPFTDLDGSSVILEVGLDVTARRRAETELELYRKHLEDLVRERTRLLEVTNSRLATELSNVEQAQRRIAESEAKLKAALSSMTDSVIITDVDGNFIDFNDAFATFYRFRNKAECARNLAEFNRMLDVRLANGEPAQREMFAVARALRGEQASNVEFSYRRRDTGETWTGSLSFGPIRDEHGKISGAVVTARDITEAKRSEARLRRFYESDLFAILYWKIDGGVIDVNDRFLAMTGYTREDLRAGRINWAQMTPPEFRALDEIAREQIRETGVHQPYEKQYIRKDGQRVWGLFWAAAYEDDRTEGVSVILDITQRKADEAALSQSEKIVIEREQLQALAERLRMAREEERTRVSRDLHDQLGQILTAIKMDLTWASKRLPDPELKRRLSESIEMVNEGVQSVRTICSGLRPGVLDDLGLSAAIEWQGREFATRTGIRCEVSAPTSDLDLSPEEKTAVFRIFQEALTNITRHAQASCVQVDLFVDDQHVVLEVSDNGKGFSEAEASGSLGILGMRERARVCGGKFQVVSSPGRGATVTVRIPLKGEVAESAAV